MSEDGKPLRHAFRPFDPPCARRADDGEPVAMFGLDRGALNGKELTFDVIRRGH